MDTPDWVGRRFSVTLTREARVQSVSSHPSGNVLLAGHTLGVLPGQTGAGLRDAFVIMLPN